MVLSLLPAAWAGNPAGKLRTLVNEFRNEPGFEMVDMGPVALGLIRAAARGEVKTEDDRKALQVFKDRGSIPQGKVPPQGQAGPRRRGNAHGGEGWR